MLVLVYYAWIAGVEKEMPLLLFFPTAIERRISNALEDSLSCLVARMRRTHSSLQGVNSAMEACRIFTNSSNPHVTTIYSYNKRCRSSGAPLVRVLDPTAEPPCRVLSGRKRSLSAPLSKFTYDYRERAFSNREGYTWTPMYQQHLVGKSHDTVNDTNTNQNSKESRSYTGGKNDLSRPNYKLFLSPFSSDESKYCPWNRKPTHQDWDVRRVKQRTSYSKFMESPYIKKQCCLNLKPKKLASCLIVSEPVIKSKFQVFSDRAKSRCAIATK